MFYELASAVQYIHNMHITHRDLKCENLLLDRQNHIKLAGITYFNVFSYLTLKYVASDVRKQ